ncbi:MAG: hypothetical protein ACI3VN_06815 [Candidatus Onthomonas sp.]
MEKPEKQRPPHLQEQLEQEWRREMGLPLKLLMLLLVLVTYGASMTMIGLCHVGEKLRKLRKG